MALNDIRLALRELLNVPAVTAVVGTRVFPVRLPQGQTQPSVVYNRITGNSDYHTLGSSGLVVTRMQIDAWARTHDLAVRAADAIKERIDGFAGTVDSIVIRGVFHESEREDFDAGSDMYRMSRDYTVWYAER